LESFAGKFDGSGAIPMRTRLQSTSWSTVVNQTETDKPAATLEADSPGSLLNQRKQLRQLLQSKAVRFAQNQDSDSPKYTPTEWKTLASKIRAAMTGKAPKTATSGWAGRIPFLPSNTSTSVVPLQRPH
jgi:hypothetical protein